MYSKPKTYSVCRAGIEVYKTDEKNFKPYISSGVVQKNTPKSSSDSEDSEDNLGYTYHRGSVQEIYYSAQLFSANYEQDYKEMNSSATVTVPSIDKNRFYKGVRVTLKEEWEEPGRTLEWDDLKNVCFGFIGDQTFNEENIEIKIDGATKLLDQKFNFEFKNMKRSKILEEIIKTAGLVPVIDVTGLDDDVTTFKSSGDKKESSSSSDLAGGEGEEIDSLVKKIVGSETDELKKAKLVHGWLKDNVKYGKYSCSRYHSAQECLKHKSALNCADTARLTRAMMASAGLKCYVVHRTTNGGHFWVIIEIGGKKYASDQTGSGSAFNTVWAASGRTTVSDGGSYTRKNGKEPDC